MNKNKVKIFDKNLFMSTWNIICVISILYSIVFTFDYTKFIHYIYLFGATFIIVIYYLMSYYRANNLTKISFKINDSIVNIYYGDIFEQEGFKVIPFNEYLDTVTDENIISSKTLNGKYIKNVCEDIDKLNININIDERLKLNKNKYNTSRTVGNKQSYQLGSIHKEKDYFLTAFSRFNSKNEAEITMTEYVSFFGKLWNEIDELYNLTMINIPLIGSGITRRRDFKEVSHQELLEVIIWTFHISRVTLREPSEVNIVLHIDERDKINLYKIKKGGYKRYKPKRVKKQVIINKIKKGR